MLPASANAEGGGLPQFDPTWYASQIFWLVITFATMFVIFSGLILPRIATILQTRRDRLENDLRMADAASRDAMQTQDMMQKTLQQTQSEAVSILAKAGNEIAALANQRHQAFRDKADAEINALQKSIDKSIKKAQVDISADISSLVADVLGKTAGVKLASNDVQTLLQVKSEAA